MSAFIVSDEHINTIVSYFMDYRRDYRLWYSIGEQYGYMDEEAAPQVAHVLHSENVRSVNERYSETASDETYQFKLNRQAKNQFTIGEIARAIDCLEYQSSESDDYYATDAYKIIRSMRKHLLNKIADREGVDLWEITTSDIAERVKA